LNKISSVGAFILARALNNNNTLKMLWLHDNQVADAGAYYFAETLSMNNSILKILDLSKNEIADEGAKYLAQMITTNISLIHLSLAENRISDVGVRILAHAIHHHNTTIEILSLAENKLLTNESISPLMQMIKHNQSLRTVNVSDCSLSENGKERMREVRQTKQNFSLAI
jgi:Ran GTPase-activating protein (RanGAP) involved in mRNA processing and transport